MGFIFRRQVKETYYVCNSYRRVFLLSWNTAAMVLYKHVPTCITDQYLARYSTAARQYIYVYIICTDIHYIMPAQCRRLMFSLLPSSSPAVKFAEIQKIYFFPSFYYSTARRRSRFRPRHRRRLHDSDEYTCEQTRNTNYCRIILLYYYC